MGLLWTKYANNGDIDQAFREEFAAVIFCAISIIGIPDNSTLCNLVGIAPPLDMQITEHTIAYNLSSNGMSLADRENEYPENELLQFERVSQLIRALVSAGSIEPALNILDALTMLHQSNPMKWEAPAIFELGTDFFLEKIDLDAAQKARITGYYSQLNLGGLNFVDVRCSLDSIVNIAKSGMPDIVAPILRNHHMWGKSFNINNHYTLLVDIEQNTQVDIKPILHHWAAIYNSPKRDLESLRIVMGYQLLTSSASVEENLLKFDKYTSFKTISEIVGAEDSHVYNTEVYKVNTGHLKELVAEFIAKRPDAINDMARDPNLHDVVTRLPGWLTHNLETDLGL
jgi:hypothetical protein